MKGYTAKPLAFPDVDDLSALFNEISPDKQPGLAYCSVSAPGRTSAWVRPTAQAVAYVEKNMIALVGGSVHYKLIVRDDDSCLVTAEYDHIIGSRWLALVPATEVDKYLPEKET